MTITEIETIINALKEGKTYFKPLPYNSVTGGTWITYDKEKEMFNEKYINESIYDRGREEYDKTYCEEKLIEMFTEEYYTDQNYIMPNKSEEYSIV